MPTRTYIYRCRSDHRGTNETDLFDESTVEWLSTWQLDQNGEWWPIDDDSVLCPECGEPGRRVT